jgi:phage portal protein BeeE
MNLHELLRSLPTQAASNRDSEAFALRIGRATYSLPWSVLRTGDIEPGDPVSCTEATLCTLYYLQTNAPNAEITRTDLVKILMALGHSNGNCYVSIRRLLAAQVIIPNSLGVLSLAPRYREMIDTAVRYHEIAQANTN